MHGYNLNLLSYQMFEGVDLMAIEGVNDQTILALISEVGVEGIKKFDSSKKFTSWLRLSPNNKISGGKILSNKIPKGSSKLKLSLRNAANAIGGLKEGHLAEFFKKIQFKRGRAAAINAVARKLAVIIWNMVTKSEPYKSPTQYLYTSQKIKMGIIKKMRKQITKFGITKDEIGIITN